MASAHGLQAAARRPFLAPSCRFVIEFPLPAKARRRDMPKSAYEKAGVSIDRGNQAVERIKSMVQRMGVQEIGKFGGFFPLKGDMKNPILVSSADGVGTKLKIAFLTGVHDTVGRDLVNHCVNDILVYGARPLFFLDYLASGTGRSQDRRRGRLRRAGRLPGQRDGAAGRGDRRNARVLPGGRIRYRRLHRRHRGQGEAWWTAKPSARATCSSACPRSACIPTATPWPGISFSKSSN